MKKKRPSPRAFVETDDASSSFLPTPSSFPPSRAVGLVTSPVPRTGPEKKPLASFAVVRRSSGRLPRRTSFVVASSVADGADFARAVEEEDARARRARGRGTVHARVLREGVSEKLGEREAHDAANPRGGDPRLSRSRGGRHPALASRTRPRGRRRRGIAPTEALERRAPRGAASLAAMPRAALPFRRPSSPAKVGGRARASGRCHKAPRNCVVEWPPYAVLRQSHVLKRAVEFGSNTQAAALCGHKASRARGRQRPTPSPSTFRVRRHDDSGPRASRYSSAS